MQEAFNPPAPLSCRRSPLLCVAIISFFFFSRLRETNFNKYDLKVTVECFGFLLRFHRLERGGLSEHGWKQRSWRSWLCFCTPLPSRAAESPTPVGLHPPEHSAVCVPLHLNLCRSVWSKPGDRFFFYFIFFGELSRNGCFCICITK